MSHLKCRRSRYLFILIVGFSAIFLAAKQHHVPQKQREGIREPEVVLIPGGKFIMGNDKGSPEEKPEHSVQVRPFYLAKYELTNEEFVAFLNDVKAEVNDSSEVFYNGLKIARLRCDHYCNDWQEQIEYKNGSFTVQPKYEQHPAVLVTWFGAMSYARWLSKKTGHTYRLPTEQEWEYAASEGKKHLKWAGTSLASRLSDFANLCDASCAIPNWSSKKLNDGYPHTAPIGQFKPNAFGLYDMTGNVHEWCGESFYIYTTQKEGSLNIPDPFLHTMRGGSWLNSPKGATTSIRFVGKADYADVAIGFRLARNVE